jgi:hypothetical protein
MRKIRNILLAGAAFSVALVLAGCQQESKHEHPGSEHPAAEKAAAEHPAAEHPK